jgi:hypothetical protein
MRERARVHFSPASSRIPLSFAGRTPSPDDPATRGLSLPFALIQHCQRRWKRWRARLPAPTPTRTQELARQVAEAHIDLRRVRYARHQLLFFLAAATLAWLGFAYAQTDPADVSLRIYAVDIWQSPPQSWGPGRGVYLGEGLVLTVQHVVGSAAQTKPSVRIAGMDLPATAIREGNFERVDLTLLSIDEQKLPVYLRMRRMSLCENRPWPGEPVIVAVPEATARSHVVLPSLLGPNIPKRLSTAISDVTPFLNSGSGVFDAGQKCLLGIISRKITRSNSAEAGSQQDIAKYFVPASTIRGFIPTDYRF